MTTSGSVNYNLTTNDLIDEAFSVCGVSSEGATISAYDYAQGRRSLNLMIKSWQASEHLWLRTEASVTLVASQASYALATLFSKKPQRIVSVRRKITTGGYETPLTEWSRQQYFDQPNKATDSTPTAFYYDPQRATGTLYVWPRASTAVAAAQTLEVTYLRPIEDFDNSNDDPDLPQEWLEAITLCLADRLAIKYVSNKLLRDDIAQRAAVAKAMIESWDSEPASLFLMPDDRC